MQRFFAESGQINEKQRRITISGTDVNHIRNVLRMKPGEELWISDGMKKEYHCSIAEIQETKVLLDILYAQEPDYELPCEIVLFQCLPKGDKMEFIIQKAAELGASGIVPVESSRCVVRLDEKKAEKKRQRWQQIAEGAAKQSRRIRIPQIGPVMSFDKALEYAKDLDIRLIPYELCGGMQKTREILSEIRPGRSVGIFIGPEGGFAPEEVEKACASGASPVTLGKRILRTETAGMTLLSVLMFQLEEDEESNGNLF